MSILLDFTIETYKALQKYDDIVNTESTEVQLKFADIWDKCYLDLIAIYKLPLLRLTGDGFEIGKATATECIYSAKLARIATGKSIYFNPGKGDLQLFQFLDQEFINLMKPNVNELINYYNRYCAQYLTNHKLKTA